jgi:hypothetical protein
MINIYVVNPISLIWIHKYTFLNVVEHVSKANYIIYESNGDPIGVIAQIKAQIPKQFHNKIIFILSGDQNSHIDHLCRWYTCAIKPNGLEQFQKQIFVTNPAIFRYSNPIKQIDIYQPRNIDIYFKGSIWKGMRTEMKEALEIYPNVNIEDFTSYWDWRFQRERTQKEIEDKAYELYDTLTNVKLSLCPKGNGNSSMRIIESIACGAVPVLINDFSVPFGFDYSRFCLVFDTEKDSYESMYEQCMELINDTERYKLYQKRGYEFYKNVVLTDFRYLPYSDYNDVNTVCYGFSSFIVNDILLNFLGERNKFYVYNERFNDRFKHLK